MSGEGVVTVRLPVVLVDKLRATAQRANMTVHQMTRQIICRLPAFSNLDIDLLDNPPSGLKTLKISLYLGPEAVDALSSIAWVFRMSSSETLRRILFAFLITEILRCVQVGEDWKLRFAE